MDILRIFNVHEYQSPIMHSLHEIGIELSDLSKTAHCVRHIHDKVLASVRSTYA